MIPECVVETVLSRSMGELAILEAEWRAAGIRRWIRDANRGS
jgi:predicted transcriptional regulator